MTAACIRIVLARLYVWLSLPACRELIPCGPSSTTGSSRAFTMLPAPGFSRELHYFIARARDTISDDALGHPCESRAVCVLFVGLTKQPLASACLLKNLISMVGACTHAKMIQSSGDLLSYEDGALMSLIGKLLAHQTAAPFEPDQGSGPKQPVSRPQKYIGRPQQPNPLGAIYLCNMSL